MSERKPCIRCERAIDEWSKICPFCNWNQSAAPPERESVPIQVAEYQPPEERSWKKLIAYAGAGVLLLFVAFGIGMLINSDATPEDAPVALSDQEQEKVGVPRRADTPLVPVNEPVAGVEQPITSAPAANAPAQGGVASEYDRSDATAVSATEYAQLAKRAKAEKKKMAVLVDPRSITGAAYAQQPRPVRPSTSPLPATGQQPDAPRGGTAVAEQPREVRRQVMRTRPVPNYQPLPAIRARGAARFDLLVGADGRVKDISVRRAIDGNTAALIGAVQRWRFKPATENGEPVASNFTVEISFGNR